jgi:hypothetical protein
MATDWVKNPRRVSGAGGMDLFEHGDVWADCRGGRPRRWRSTSRGGTNWPAPISCSWFRDADQHSRAHRGVYSLRGRGHRVHSQCVGGPVAAAGRSGLEDGRPDRHLGRRVSESLLLSLAPRAAAAWNSWRRRGSASTIRFTPRTRLVAISTVNYSTGFRPPLEEISETLRRRGILLYLDGTQSLGALQFDVSRIRPDLFAVDAYKWLLSPNGAGFMYVSPELRERLAPAVIGWRSHQGLAQSRESASWRAAVRHRGGEVRRRHAAVRAVVRHGCG